MHGAIARVMGYHQVYNMNERMISFADLVILNYGTYASLVMYQVIRTMHYP